MIFHAKNKFSYAMQFSSHTCYFYLCINNVLT